MLSSKVTGKNDRHGKKKKVEDSADDYDVISDIKQRKSAKDGDD